jgi:three-Cys-motif partner protein
MLVQSFGGTWTDQKLKKVSDYLPAYMHVLQGKGFKVGYIDAFAGTGYRTLRSACPDMPGLFEELEDEDAQSYRDGSARMALRTIPPFDKYIFIEKDSKKCAELEGLKTEFQTYADRIDIRNGDANDCIADLCSCPTRWNHHRAVMFLDPFGMQVDWTTVEMIAATKAIDLWYLFPIGSVNRLLERDQCRHPSFAECLDRTLGANDWRTVFYETHKEQSLFGSELEITNKVASFSAIGSYIVKRLKTIFAGVAETPYTLKNSKNVPLFMLCFAVGNPNPKAVAPALKIARDILMKD